MALRLRKREIPTVEFRRELPDWLADGEPCFIEIEARAGGSINPAYMEGMEQVGMRARVLDRKAERITDDDEFVQTNFGNVRASIRLRLGALYDACVIEWRSNIVELDEKDKPRPIVCDRERFLALTEARVPEIARAIEAFESECLEAGRIIRETDEATAKN